MTSVKTFGIRVEARGEGWHRHDAIIAEIGEKANHKGHEGTQRKTFKTSGQDWRSIVSFD
jgi:hypothetical protein